MLAKNNGVIAAAIAESAERAEARGEARGLRAAIRALADAFDLPIARDREAELEAMDNDALRALLDRLRTQRRWS